MIRPLALRDLSQFNHTRKNGLLLHSVPLLVWGPSALSAGALLSPLSSISGVQTSVLQKGNEDALFGQAIHRRGAPLAQLTYLAPFERAASNDSLALLEQLISWVSTRGAHSIIAVLEESSAIFEAMRQAGFNQYTHQHIWRITHDQGVKISGKHWRPAEASDLLAIKLLCASVIPGIIQQAEPTPEDRHSGMLHYENGDLRAYIDVRRGTQGIWIQPFVHSEAQSFNHSFQEIVQKLNPSPRRPLYVCIRAYQEQIESQLKEMGAEKGPRLAVMVKRTDVRFSVRQRQAIIERNGRRAEPSASIRVPLQRAGFEMEVNEYD
jgi:hypothetical protein